MPRVVHKATDLLSLEAQRVMIGGFRDKLSARMIAGKIEAATGEKVMERTVSRRYREWHLAETRREAAREQMTGLIEAMQAGGMEPAQMVMALGVDALMMDPEALTSKDPLRVQALALRAEELRNKRDEIDLRRRAVDVDEKRVNALLERERRAAAASGELEEKAAGGGVVTAEDVRRIRDLYGLPAAEARA